MTRRGRRCTGLWLGATLALATAATLSPSGGGMTAAADSTPAAGRGPAPAAPAGFVPPAVELQVADRIDAARLERTVRELVKLGPRMGGTPSGDHAAASIAAAFAESRLVPQVVEDPAELAHWEDGWSVELVGSPLGETDITLRRVPGGALASAYPYGFSPSVGPAAAPLVVVGDLGSASPSRRHDWRGKVLYTPGDVLRPYRLLVAAGAAADRPLAILTSFPSDGRRYLDASRLEALPPSLRTVPRAIDRTRPLAPPDAPWPVPVFAVSFQDGRKLAAAATAATATAAPTIRVRLTSTVRAGRPRTVLASIPGRDRDSYYLICAHGDSDSGGPGADDNASGEAVVMELARVLAGLVRDGRLPPPRATLRFAVWGKEYSSSRAFVAREGDRLRRCRGVINLDEVGTGAERDAIYFESNEVPWNRELLRTFDRVGADYLGRPGFWPEYTTNPSQGGTDSYAFLPRRYKGELASASALQVPATTVYTAAWDHLGHLRQTPGWESPGTPDPVQLAIDYSRYYHSSGDTPENTTDRKPQAMVRAARAIGIALLRLAF